MARTSDDDISGWVVGDAVKVYVGPKRKCYTVHKGLLTQNNLFTNEIKNSASSSESLDHIFLTEEDPKFFELLVSWLYRKKLNVGSTTNEEVTGPEYLDLYFKACKSDMHELQNALMDLAGFRKTCGHGCAVPELTKIIYKNTTWPSPLRAYIVDSFIYNSDNWGADAQLFLKTHLKAGNHDFVLDCYEALFQLCAKSTKSKIRDPERKTGCVYHTHEAGEACRK